MSSKRKGKKVLKKKPKMKSSPGAHYDSFEDLQSMVDSLQLSLMMEKDTTAMLRTKLDQREQEIESLQNSLKEKVLQHEEEINIIMEENECYRNHILTTSQMLGLKVKQLQV